MNEVCRVDASTNLTCNQSEIITQVFQLQSGETFTLEHGG